MFRLAVKYIKHLQYLLDWSPNQNIPGHIVEFDPTTPPWIKDPSVPGEVRPALDRDGNPVNN